MYGDAVRALNEFLYHEKYVRHKKKKGCPPGQCSCCMYGSQPDSPACYTCDWEEKKLEWFRTHKEGDEDW